jgi:adenylate cyclase
MEVAAEHGAQVAVSDELLRAAGRSSRIQIEGRISGPVDTLLRGRMSSISVCLWWDNRIASKPETNPLRASGADISH